MSLTININLPDVDSAGNGGVSRAALDMHLDALGFIRDRAPREALASSTAYERLAAHEGAVSTAPKDEPDVATTVGVTNTHPAVTLTNTERAGESEAQHAARRERGKPAPGRARRTKEEIAEDEEADKAEASSTQQSISTGEERVNPEDDEATQAQDRADEEAEEGKADTPEAKPLTVMDGKNAIGDYVQKFKIEAAQADGMAIFVSALGQPPEGKAWGWNLLTEMGDQAKIDAAVRAWQAAAASDKRFGA